MTAGLTLVTPDAAARRARMDAIHADVDATVRRFRAGMLKSAARRYLKEPWRLDAISPGLSVSSPRRILAVVESEALRRFGSNPVGALDLPLNLGGAKLAARWARMEEWRHAMEMVP